MRYDFSSSTPYFYYTVLLLLVFVLRGRFLEPNETNDRRRGNKSKERRSPSTIYLHDIKTRLFINNQFVESEEGRTFPTIDPATEKVICYIQEAGCEDVDRAVSILWTDSVETCRGLTLSQMTCSLHQMLTSITSVDSCDVYM